MTIGKDSYEVFYINFSLEEKLQNLPDGSQGIALSFQRPIKISQVFGISILMIVLVKGIWDSVPA